MKVIDLLNKIANGEEVPEKIKYDTKEMKYDRHKQDYLGYYSNGNGEWLFQYLFDRCRNTKHFINDEVEIIEEKKIPEKLEKYYDENLEEYVVETYIKGVNYKEILNSKYDEMIISKINEVLDYLKNKGE